MMKKNILMVLLGISSLSPMYAFENAREVSADLMEILRDVLSSEEKSDDLKKIAALLLESLPQETQDDVKLYDMYAKFFARTYETSSDSVELPIARIKAEQEKSRNVQDNLNKMLTACNAATEREQKMVQEKEGLLATTQKDRDDLTSKLATCDQNVQSQTESLKKANEDLNAVTQSRDTLNKNLDALKTLMQTHSDTKEKVTQLHQAYKDVVKNKGTIKDQGEAVQKLKTAWIEHEAAVTTLNDFLKSVNIQSEIQLDNSQKKSIVNLIELYEQAQ